LFTEKSIHFLASKKKIEFLKQIENISDPDLPQIKLLVKDKNDKDKANFETLLGVMESSKKGKTVGVFAKDNFPGEFCESWRATLKGKEFEQVDISGALGWIMCAKEESEVLTVKKACLVTVDVFNKYLKDHIMEIIDADKKVKHSKLAEGVEQALTDKKYVTGVDMGQLDMCYPAIIQSGGNYSLKFSAVSDKNHLHFGAIVCSLGVRYKSYCSNIVRTLLVNPSETLQDQYNFLVNLEEEMLKIMLPGKKLSDIYDFAMSYAKKEKPNLVDNLTKTFGFAMGLEFRDNSLMIGPKCTAVLRKGMVFNLNMGLSNLTNREASDKEGKHIALFIGDTVLVNDEENPASILTQSKKKVKILN
jgi:nucleosome binding factor SPN SPT16 subunit